MPIFNAALLRIVKIQKQPKCPSRDEWIKKIWGVCVWMYICVCVCVYI